MAIHPTALVDPAAEVCSNVEIGPFAVIEPGVLLADGCRVGARATIKTGSAIGANTVIGEGAVIGGLPQHLNAPAENGRVSIGADNVIREHVTIHRAMHADGVTRIGDSCLLMVGTHVAHDCSVGHHVILTNNVLLGGHVTVQDRACLGGAAAVHQNCRVGRLAMVAATAKVVKDVPPYVLTSETAEVVGLNKVGLRRAGIDRTEVDQLKTAYQLIYRRGMSFREMLATLKAEFPGGIAADFSAFFSEGKRGFIQERRSPPTVAIKLHPAAAEQQEEVFPRRMVG